MREKGRDGAILSAEQDLDTRLREVFSEESENGRRDDRVSDPVMTDEQDARPPGEHDCASGATGRTAEQAYEGTAHQQLQTLAWSQ
jgi:hypothetical protein